MGEASWRPTNYLISQKRPNLMMETDPTFPEASVYSLTWVKSNINLVMAQFLLWLWKSLSNIPSEKEQTASISKHMDILYLLRGKADLPKHEGWFKQVCCWQKITFVNTYYKQQKAKATVVHFEILFLNLTTFSTLTTVLMWQKLTIM